ncbi:MAG: type II toxin-antitoxin system RelE/ParE family toxin [Bacteroidota bacterium]
MPNFQLRFHSLAREELREAYQYYETQQVGLGDRFFEELDRIFDLIVDNPKLFAVDFEEIRKAPIQTFPFTIYYEAQDNDVFVYSVFHQGREPGSWKGRT